MKLFLSAGHAIKASGKDPGATGNGYWEGDLAFAFVSLLNTELLNLGVKATVDNKSNILVNTLSVIKSLATTEDWLLIEFHFNAGGPTATGVEVVIPKVYDSKEQKVAKDIADIISRKLNIKLRGKAGVITEDLTARGTLGWMRPTGKNILVELCFISNKSDIDSYNKNKVELAKAIAQYLKNV